MFSFETDYFWVPVSFLFYSCSVLTAEACEKQLWSGHKMAERLCLDCKHLISSKSQSLFTSTKLICLSQHTVSSEKPQPSCLSEATCDLDVTLSKVLTDSYQCAFQDNIFFFNLLRKVFSFSSVHFLLIWFFDCNLNCENHNLFLSQISHWIKLKKKSLTLKWRKDRIAHLFIKF